MTRPMCGQSTITPEALAKAANDEKILYPSGWRGKQLYVAKSHGPKRGNRWRAAWWSIALLAFSGAVVAALYQVVT